MRALGYKGKKYRYKSVADVYHVPREMFWRRLSGSLMGNFGHIAGGCLNQQNFISISHPSLLTTLIHLALPNNLTIGALVPVPVLVPPTPAPAPVPAAVPAPVATADRKNGKEIFYFLFLFYFRSHVSMAFCVIISVFQTPTFPIVQA